MAKAINVKKEEVIPPIETERQFLERILKFQHTGGWGKHLDPMIMERIKLLGGDENKIWVVDGEVVGQDVEKVTPKEWLQ